MKNDYKITIDTYIEGKANQIINVGTIYKEYGDKIVEYTNYTNDFNYKTKIVIGSDIISIINFGEIESIINLELGQTHTSLINTGSIQIPLKVKLNHLEKEITNTSLNLFVEYEISYLNSLENFKIKLKAEKIS